MRSSFNMFFGLIFIIAGVGIGFWANSHHPDNAKLSNLKLENLIDKDFWVFSSMEYYYKVIAFACILSVAGIIGFIQQLVSDLKNNKIEASPNGSTNTGEKTGGKGCLFYIVSIFGIVVLIISIITVLGNSIKESSLQKEPEPKPLVPVNLTMRASLVGEGMVAVFNNQTSENIRVFVTLENKEMKQTKNGYLDFGPNAKQEIGWIEGWKFMPGEYITISHPDYSSLRKIVVK